MKKKNIYIAIIVVFCIILLTSIFLIFVNKDNKSDKTTQEEVTTMPTTEEVIIEVAVPVISENTAEVYIGKDVVLRFQSDKEYEDAITSITIDQKEVFKTEFVTIESGKITLDKSLFTIKEDGDSQTYEITVKAIDYPDNTVFQTVYNESLWTLTFFDEFDGTGDNLDPNNNLDLSKWAYQNGNGAEYGISGWGNNEKQYYTNDNILVENGVLRIQATKEAKGGVPYSSGKIRTVQDDNTPLFMQTYGRFEAKIKLPGKSGSQGLWPAFWMLPVYNEYGEWPLSGEIDILEARGREPQKVEGTIHYGDPWPNNRYSGGHHYWLAGTSTINDYHVYAVEWEPGEIRWYVDGKLFHKENSWYIAAQSDDIDTSFPAPFNQPFYIILNLAVGGHFDGNKLPNDSVMPANMFVDYVRAYEYNKGYTDDEVDFTDETEDIK